MPDFKSMIAEMKAQQAQATGAPVTEDPQRQQQTVEDQYQEQVQERQRIQQQGYKDPMNIKGPQDGTQAEDPNQQEYDLSAASYAGDPNARASRVDEIVSDNRFVGFKGLNEDSYIDPESWSANYVSQSLLGQAQNNIMFGVGQMIGDYGDIAQFVGSALPGVDMYEGNFISKMLQELGQDIQDKNLTFMPPEIMDPEFKMSTFANPQFWATHGARFIPQLLEIAATYGVGSLAKKGVSMGAKALLRETLSEGAEVAAKKGLKATVDGVYAGAKGINEVAGSGKGLIGKLVTDRGNLTKTFGQVISTTAAGTATNLRVSLANAGEVYNTYKDLKDEEGHDLFGKEELSQMASGAFLNNMQYIGMDILSWGMTYGKGAQMFKNSGLAQMSKKFTKNYQSKYMSGLFANTASPAMKKFASLGGKMVKEGFEETIQESFEEWSKIQAYRDVHGSLHGYKGMELSKDYDKDNGFFDFYMSKENEATRAISFALGGMGAGVFNIKSLINKSADETHKMTNRAENLKQIFDKGTQGKIWDDYHIRSTMAELIFEGKEHAWASNIDAYYQAGKIDKDDVAKYEVLFDKMAAVKNDISGLKIKGKKALMTNIMAENFFNDSIEIEKAKAANNVAVHQRLISDPDKLARAIAKEERDLNDKMIILSSQAANAKSNQESLLTGGTAQVIDFDVKQDQYGEPFITNGNIDDQEGNTEETSTGKKEAKGTGLAGQARGIFNKAMSGFKNMFGDTDRGDGEPDINANENLDREGAQDLGDGAIDALNDSNPQDMMAGLQIGDTIDVDGEEGTVTGFEENIDGSRDSMDYEIPISEDRKNTLITKEESDHQKRNARITPKGNWTDNSNTNKVLNIKRKPKPGIQGEGRAKLKEDPKADDVGPNIPDVTDAQKELENRRDAMLDGVIDPEFIADVNKKFDEDVQALNDQNRADSISKKQSDEQARLDAMSDADIDNDPEISDKEKSYIKRATKRKRKKISLSEEDAAFMKGLKEKAKTKAKEVGEDASTLAKEIFGDEIIADFSKQVNKAKSKIEKIKKAVNEKFGSNSETKNPNNSPRNIINNAFEVLKKKLKWVQEKKETIQVNKQLNEGYINRKLSAVDQDHFYISQMTGINEKIGMMYPDVAPRAYVISDLAEVVEMNVIGYTLAGNIYIDENSWDQDRIFMHEMAHINYQLSKDTPETQAFLKQAIKNNDLVNRVLKDYEGDIMYLAPSLGVGLQIGRSEIIGDYWDASTYEQREQIIKDKVQKGEIVPIPLINQSIIAEEIFTTTLEGPLSKKYTRLFEPQNETKRKYLSKRWWGGLKQRAKNAKNDFKENESRFLKTLSGNDSLEYTNAKEHIIESFQKAVEGKDLSASGRAKKIKENDAALAARRLDINNKWKENVDKELGLKGPRPRREIDNLELMNNLEDSLDPDTTFNEDRMRYLHKASQIIREFSKNYNIVLKKRYFNENKDNDKADWTKIPKFDGDMLQIKLYELAHQSSDATEFMDKMNNTTVEELFEFKDYVESVRTDSPVFFQGFWNLASNQQIVNATKSFIDANGKYSIQNSLNMKETSMFENSLDNVYKSIAYTFSKNASQPIANQRYIDNYVNYKATADRIRTGNYTNQDMFDVLEFFSDGRINTKEIMKYGRLNINGKNFTLDSAVRAFLRSPNGMGEGNTSKVEKGKDQIYIYQKGNRKNYELASGVRTFIQSLVATNRNFTADYTTMDANNNQAPVREINNDLFKKVKSMEKDAVTLGRNNFIKKYALMSKNLPKGSLSNNLLNYIYDSVQDGRGISINKHLGIENQSTGNTSVIKESNSAEQSLNEFLMYTSTSREGGKRKNTYIMDLGRFADSPRAYTMDVPKIHLSEFGTMSDGKFEFNKKQKAYFDTAYNINKKFGYKGSIDDYKALIQQKIDNEIKFLNDNVDAAGNISSISSLFENGILNDKGKSFAAEYTINQHLNSTFFMEMFMPSFSGENLVKRAKALTSPGFSMPKSVKIEAIPIIDDYLIDGETELTDGAMYMLADDIHRLEQAFGNVMPIGKGLKGLAAGVEYDNASFQDKNINHKGYIFMLNDEVVKDNPRLAPLYELLKSRREQYESRHGNIEQNLFSGFPTQLTYAYHTSADKAKSTPNEMYNPDMEKTDSGQAFSLDGMADPTRANEILDKWYYKDNPNGDKEFSGLSGENFSIQQIMDKETEYANTPVQMIRFILTNAGIDGNLEKAEDMQRLLVDLMGDQVARTMDILDNGTPEQLRELIIEGMNMDDVDPLQRDAILIDKLSLSVPYLRELVRNQLSNTIKREANKYKSNGTIAQQKPAHYQKKYGSTNGTDGLAFYNDRSDGGLTLSEAIVPSYMKGKVKARQTLYIDDNGNVITDIPNFNKNHANPKQLANMSMEEFLANSEKFAKAEADKRGVGIGEIKNKSGKVVGHYVAGDTIIATRIPAHSPASTGVFEVIDFDKTGASNVQLPHEFSLGTTGGDFDGDQVFIQHKGSAPKFNRFMDMMQEHWLSPSMAAEVRMVIDFKDDAKNAIKYVESIFGDNYMGEDLLGSPDDRRKAFNNTLITKGSIGTTANLHGLISMVAAYNTPLSKEIRIDKKVSTAFKDNENGSRTIDSAKIFNIILDNAKHQYADKLGINEHTDSYAVILANMGFDLGQIGVMLNSKVVKDWIAIKTNQQNSFSKNFFTSDLAAMVRKKRKLGKPSKLDIIIIDTKDIDSSDNMKSTLELLTYMDQITEQLNEISSIMSGHKSIEVNPFLLQDQIDKFEAVMNNNGNKSFTVSEQFKNNPIIKNYLQVAKFTLEQQRKLDPVYRPDGSEIFNRINDGSTINLSKAKKQKLYNDISLFFTSRLLGMNNIEKSSYKSLVEPGPNNIYDRLQAHVNELRKTIVYKDPDNFFKSITAFQNNLLFSKALNMNSGGRNKYLSLRDGFFRENMSKPLRERVIREFNALPKDLKQDLILYDLMTHGWKDSKSMFPLFSDGIKMHISNQSTNDIKTKDSHKLDSLVKIQMMKSIIQQNPDFLQSTDKEINGVMTVLKPIRQDSKGAKKFIIENIPSNIMEQMKLGKEAIFKSGKYIYHFPGFGIDDMPSQSMNASSIESYTAQKAAELTAIYPIGSDKNNESIVSIKDLTTSGPPVSPQAKIIEEYKNSNPKIQGKGRAVVSEWYRHYNTMSRQEYDVVMEYDKNVEESVKEAMFDGYIEELKSANAALYNVNEESVKKMTDGQLSAHFANYGKRNKFSYARVLNPIVLEMTNREAQEQIKNYNGNQRGLEDISALDSYFIANNIPSRFPEIQSLVRNLEVEYKKYIEEKNNYVKKINKATDDLYVEKFGYSVNEASTKDLVKAAYNSLVKNRADMYKTLYGNLVEFESIQKGPKTIQNMKYKDENVIEQGFKDGTITSAEYHFYKTTKGITDELKPFVLKQGGEARTGYIPHTGADMMEALSRRGLLGFMVNAKKVNNKIGDVRMTVVNPLNGITEKGVKFSDIENMYNALSKIQKAPLSKSIDYLRLKNKAIQLLKKGLNEDGSNIVYSEITAGSAIGDVFMNRFAMSRSDTSTDFPSLDLNKAFVDYVGTSVFTHGNSNFQGMKRMLPYVDGALAQAERMKNPHMAKYVDKIWKKYFLGGQRQKSIPTPSELETLGITSDKVIDFITKGSLIYWLGWKGLAIGKGFYAIGNVLVGKYKNIKNAGGANWAKGEGRFWKGVSGEFDVSDPFKGIRDATRILKNIGFMDINVYDDVNVQTKTSFDKLLTNFALMPMIYSEKWIQGVHFLGMLTDAEWDNVRNGGKLDKPRLTQIENEVKNSHGKGYQATDQRMIQMYSWGRNMMQFSRFIPTMLYDNMGKEDINIYGQKYIGAYRAMWKPINKMITGEITPAEFARYRKNLDSVERSRLDSGLIGFGLMSALLAVNTAMPNKHGEGLFWDANILFDTDRMQNKFSATPSMNMMGQLTNF